MISVNCGDCKLCCRFYYLVGERRNFVQISEEYIFSQTVADIFFPRLGGQYLVSPVCQYLQGGKCGIFGRKEKPSLCSLYPVVAAETRSGISVYVDQHCPHWQKIFDNLKIKAKQKEVVALIRGFQQNDSLELYPFRIYRDAGYRLRKAFQLR